MPWINLLDQTEVWVNREGEEIRVDEIDARYAANICRFLERRAVGIFFHYNLDRLVRLPMDMGEEAERSVLDHMDEQSRDPVGWLREKPLFKAIAARKEQL